MEETVVRGGRKERPRYYYCYYYIPLLASLRVPPPLQLLLPPPLQPLLPPPLQPLLPPTLLCAGASFHLSQPLLPDTVPQRATRLLLGILAPRNLDVDAIFLSAGRGLSTDRLTPRPLSMGMRWWGRTSKVRQTPRPRPLSGRRCMHAAERPKGGPGSFRTHPSSPKAPPARRAASDRAHSCQPASHPRSLVPLSSSATQRTAG